MGFRAEIVKKFLAGRFSLEEKERVDAYFLEDRYTRDVDRVLEEYWDELTGKKSLSVKKLDHILDRIVHHIHLDSVRRAGPFRILWQTWSRVAAVLLLPVLLLSGHFLLHNHSGEKESWVEVHSPYGSRVQFSLPDGSTGWLNGGSVICYPAQFERTRTVRLEGEAFFEVVKNPSFPFLVSLKGMDIRVVGTSFNVVAYAQDSITEVTVASGKVQVKGKDLAFQEKLLPSEHLEVNLQRKRVSKSVVDVESYISWKNGKLVFRNEQLDDVMRKVARYYNADVEIAPEVSREQSFRAILEDEALAEVLRYMELTMPISCSVRERGPTPEGTVSKRKIIINNAIK
ncbi:MAG: FecR family protein [Mangrovibacterium sp.]